ncbi:DNA repair protein RAD51 homolog 3 [Phlebotomus papatasi]|uniref:DNA repair protein RAD51 homolog 3 n=1 Tax=Phlebotomus papatasi TaxID=29031 RepID=UPI00248412BD|nr:DNA repair protein RAD51 homolog 3 [Phlebotomus papatasi]
MACSSTQDLLDPPDLPSEDIFRDFFQQSLWDMYQDPYHRGSRGILHYIKELDFATIHGIQTGYLTEICGLFGSGRTAMCVKLCISVCVPPSLHGLDGESVYIDSRRLFNPNLVRNLVMSTNQAMKEQFARIGFRMNYEDVMKRIHYMKNNTHEELIGQIEFLKGFLETHPRVRLLVLDSLIMPFHGYQGKSYQRVCVIMDVLFRLEDLAVKYDLAVVIVNDMTTRILPGGSSKVIPALGTYFRHKISYMLLLTELPDRKYAAELRKNFKNAGKIVTFSYF